MKKKKKKKKQEAKGLEYKQIKYNLNVGVRRRSFSGGPEEKKEKKH
jgi:hypothetical protein